MNEIIYNTYEEDIKIYGDFKLPVPTYVLNKKIDFSVIVSLLLKSNTNLKESNTIYIDDIRLDKDAICKECNINRATLERRLKYLCETNILEAKNTDRGLIYIINYSKDNKYYVTIEHRILKYLLEHTDKDVIKMYILLKVQCDILKNNKPMSNAYLCSQLGYSTTSANNLSKIGRLTNTLVEHGLIEKVQKRIYKMENGKKVIMRTDTYYKINNLKIFYLNK